MYILDSKALAKSVDAYCSFFGITKKDFHAQSGISSGKLSQWRNGTYEPAKESVEKLIKYTGLSIGDLLSCNFTSVVPEENRKYVTVAKTPITKSDEGNNGKYDELEQYILEVMRALPFEGKIRLVSSAQSLKEEWQVQGTRKESE